MDLPAGSLSPLTAAILLSFDWGIAITLPWNNPAKFNQTHHFCLSVHSCWDPGFPKGICRWGWPQTQMLQAPKPYHENLESHTTISHPEVLEQTNLKSSKCKISRVESKSSLPEILESAEEATMRALWVSSPVPRSHLQNRQQLTSGPISSPRLPNNKQKQLSSKFDILHSREDFPWIGEIQCLTSSGSLFPLRWLL